MIKRILVALDVDVDTPVATRHAAEIARRYDAEVTGLAVVDMGSIRSEARGGGIGSMYYAEQLRERLTTEARDRARRLLKEFEQAAEENHIRHGELVEEGVPFERIVEDMKFYDLLVIGNDPHFFYSHPEQKTETLVKVVKDIIGPALIVGDDFRTVQRVVVAYDGSTSAARALRRFVHLKPFGTDLHMELLHVQEGASREEAELMLGRAQAYVEAHGFSASTVIEQGDPNTHIVEYLARTNADLVVAGAHSVSKLRRMAFGSTTSALLESCPVPLFIDS